MILDGLLNAEDVSEELKNLFACFLLQERKGKFESEFASVGDLD